MSKDYKLARRRYVIGGFISLLVVIYVIRLFGLQLGDHTYRENADSNAFFKKVLYPMRGLIYDRNGRLVVYNQPAYDLMVTPREAVDFDTLQLCKILGMSRADFDALVGRDEGYAQEPRLFVIYTTEAAEPAESGGLWPYPGEAKPAFPVST